MYVRLLDDEVVLHRAEIYEMGPLIDWVHPDILALVLQLQPPVRDFGCGDGTLIRALHERGIYTVKCQLAGPGRVLDSYGCTRRPS